MLVSPLICLKAQFSIIPTTARPKCRWSCSKFVPKAFSRVDLIIATLLWKIELFQVEILLIVSSARKGKEKPPTHRASSEKRIVTLKNDICCVKITLLIMLEKHPSHAHEEEKKKEILTSASMKSFQNLPELGNCVTSRSYVFLALSMGWF